MRNIHYKNRSIRISEENWEKLKKEKIKYKSWNLLVKKVLELLKDKIRLNKMI